MPPLEWHVLPGAKLAAPLERVPGCTAQIEVEPERNVVDVTAVDLLTRSVNHDDGAKLPVVMKAPDMVVLVIGAVQVVLHDEIKTPYNLAHSDLAARARSE